MTAQPNVTAAAVEQIRLVDQQLLVAGERLQGYRISGPPTSWVVQQGVVDRLLDRRLMHMRERDR